MKLLVGALENRPRPGRDKIVDYGQPVSPFKGGGFAFEASGTDLADDAELSGDQLHSRQNVREQFLWPAPAVREEQFRWPPPKAAERVRTEDLPTQSVAATARDFESCIADMKQALADAEAFQNRALKSGLLNGA